MAKNSIDAYGAAGKSNVLFFDPDVLALVTEDPAIAGVDTTTGTALDLLAELFRRADARTGELARYADDARIAGAACERSYDAVSLGNAVGAGVAVTGIQAYAKGIQGSAP